MLTLTYGPMFPSNGYIAKYNLHCVLGWLKKKFGSYSYFWFQEYQGRGAVHYHIVTTIPVNKARRKLYAKYWVDLLGYEDWPYSSLKSKKLFHVKQSTLRVAMHKNTWQELRNKEDGAVRYAAKYAAKLKQKTPPAWVYNVGRFWGCSRDLELKGVYAPWTLLEIKQLLNYHGHKAAGWDYLPKIVLKTW